MTELNMRTSLSCPLFLILCNPSSIHIVARVVFSKEEPACVILLIKMKSKGLGVTGKDFHGLATPRFPSRCPPTLGSNNAVTPGGIPCWLRQ